MGKLSGKKGSLKEKTCLTCLAQILKTIAQITIVQIQKMKNPIETIHFDYF